MTSERFAIVHRGPYRWLATVLGARTASIDVGAERIDVTYGPWFRAHVPRSAVADVMGDRRRVVSRGVHGWRGRWLVNGAGVGLVRLRLDPEQRARTLGFPVRLRELIVNVAEPDALIAALATIRRS